MEVNYMLAYGSAEASLRLLWKFGLVEILLPIQVLIGFFSPLFPIDLGTTSLIWIKIAGSIFCS